MSRSKRKSPAGGMACCRSEKDDKRKANRAFRRAEHATIQSGRLDGTPFSIRQVSDPWCMGKDGKVWFGEQTASTYKLMRK